MNYQGNGKLVDRLIIVTSSSFSTQNVKKHEKGGLFKIDLFLGQNIRGQPQTQTR